jgi:hypothetical protein
MKTEPDQMHKMTADSMASRIYAGRYWDVMFVFHVSDGPQGDMKYKLDRLTLSISPDTREDESLLLLLEKMQVQNNTCAIHNAGTTWDGGRRMVLNLAFICPTSGTRPAASATS